MKLFLIIQEDRHIDVAVEVWDCKVAAEERCEEIARQNKSPAFSITPEEVEDTVRFISYNCEGDCVYVQERELNKAYG